jgi:hypothetical protein
MKRVNKSPKELATWISRTVGQTVKSPKGICHKKKLHHPFPNAVTEKSSPLEVGCDMANKVHRLVQASCLENDSMKGHTWLASVRLVLHKGFFPEVSQDHEKMPQVLFSRNLRLDVALTFWRKKSKSELVTYLVRIEDLERCGRSPFCAPNSLQEEKQYISLGCCVDLLPLVSHYLKAILNNI